MGREVVTTLNAVRDRVRGLRVGGAKVALVPTMGALHDGHLELVRAAQRQADAVIVSIFVNPTQFAPHEDFDRYPRQLEADMARLEMVGDALVYAPTRDILYPDGDSTRLMVSGVSEHFEGAFRPHFFSGVASVVARLFIHVTPDVALFGEKDFQQLQVIARMTRDLGLPVEVVGVPTVRDGDGLALSSRNAYLSADARARAVALPQAMMALAASLRAGAALQGAEGAAHAAVHGAGFSSIDYLTAADARTMTPLGPGPVSHETMAHARVLAAAWLDGTRLIDNCPV